MPDPTASEPATDRPCVHDTPVRQSDRICQSPTTTGNRNNNAPAAHALNQSADNDTTIDPAVERAEFTPALAGIDSDTASTIVPVTEGPTPSRAATGTLTWIAGATIDASGSTMSTAKAADNRM